MNRPAKTGEFFLSRLEENRDVQEVQKQQSQREIRRISSRSIVFYKHFFPILFGVSVCIVAWCVLDDIVIGQRMLQGSITPFLLITFAVIGFVSYRLTKRIYTDSVDEVWDADDALIVKNKGHEQRIDLADCTKLLYDSMGLHHRITLVLSDASDFGTDISFIVPFNISSFLGEFELSDTPRLPSLLEDLNSRIEAARLTPENRHTASGNRDFTESNEPISLPPRTQIFFRPLLESIRSIWRKRLSTIRHHIKR